MGIQEIFIKRNKHSKRLKGRAGREKGMKDFLLLDPRGAYDPEAAILLIGTIKEIVEAANSGEYGDGCIVADKTLSPMWELFCSDFKWRVEGNGGRP